MKSGGEKGYREVVTLNVLRAKFTQHPTLAEALLATGDQKLIEASPFDGYWGLGKDGKGLNRLGKLLMTVRGELRSGALPLDPSHPFAVQSLIVPLS